MIFWPLEGFAIAALVVHSFSHCSMKPAQQQAMREREREKERETGRERESATRAGGGEELPAAAQALPPTGRCNPERNGFKPGIQIPKI